MAEEFYRNSEIFLTGGTGVIGKAAIEKLFRSCDVKRIYVLVRPKKNVMPEDRLKDIKKSRIFRVLKEQRPNELDKLFAIPGDITQDHLGISEENRNKLKNVSVFIHSAASTNFNLSLRTAIESNLKSTLEALKLAETFINLKIFVHVSTFFCNPSIAHLEDKVYPPILDWKTALKLLDSSYAEKEPILDAIETKVIDEFPNTYVFTKNLAEQLVNDFRHKLPVTIFRPSIVMPALRDPELGFTETMVGVMGLLSLWATGLMQVLLCNPSITLDLVPLDACTNYMLVHAAMTSRLKQETFSESIPIGTVSSWGILTCNLRKMGNLLTALGHKNPLEKSVWIPNVKITACPFVYWVYTIFLQLFPSTILDVLLRLCGQRPFMMRLQRKLYYTTKALNFFLYNQFATDGTSNFDAVLAETKGTVFDVSCFEHCCANDEGLINVLEINMKGARKFLLNEDESTIPRCRKILKVKKIIYIAIKLYVLYLVASCVLRRVLSRFEV